MLARLAAFVRQQLIGLLALFVALGGTAYAATLPRNSVGTAQLKHGAVTSSKIKNGALLRRDFARGTLIPGPAGATGARGPEGIQGPEGARGLTGPAGPAGATNVVVRTATVTNQGSVTVECRTGETAVGGGVFPTEAAYVTFSEPVFLRASGRPFGWYAGATLPDGGTPGGLVGYALCASP